MGYSVVRGCAILVDHIQRNQVQNVLGHVSLRTCMLWSCDKRLSFYFCSSSPSLASLPHSLPSWFLASLLTHPPSLSSCLPTLPTYWLLTFLPQFLFLSHLPPSWVPALPLAVPFFPLQILQCPPLAFFPLPLANIPYSPSTILLPSLYQCNLSN